MIAALVLVFLAVLWYLSFVALNARGPERAFFTKESWTNGTVSLYVSDLDAHGEVLLSTLNVTIITPGGERLYSGPLGQDQPHGNFTLHVAWVDNDNTSTLTLGDDLRITAKPPEAADALILATLYLYSNGREWGQYRFE